MSRLFAALLLAVVATIGLAAPASAHNTLVGSDPAGGAALPAGPQKVTLTFDQPVQQGFNTITVTAADGTRWEDGPASVSGSTVSAPLRPLGPAGEYTIGYRILSADGHPVSGAVKFTLTTPGTGTPASVPPPGEAPPASGGGMPVWPWIVGAVLLLAVGVVLALRIGRSEDDRR